MLINLPVLNYKMFRGKQIFLLKRKIIYVPVVQRIPKFALKEIDTDKANMKRQIWKDNRVELFDISRQNVMERLTRRPRIS